MACVTPYDPGHAPARASEEVISGDELGTGREHGCGDDGPWSRGTALNAIPGVDPARAVATSAAAYTIYLAPGVTAADLPQELGNIVVPHGS